MKCSKAARWLSFFLVPLLVLGVMVLPAAAITPVYQVSSAYRASTYYENLKNLPLTGDGAFDTLSAALSQYTYHEGSSTADFGGGNTSSSGNFTEYNYALGKISGTYSYAWCAAFVSWCLSQAGEADSAGGLFASCTLWVAELTDIGQYKTRASGYKPIAGDLIFFRSAGVSRASDHVGLVRYVKDGRVYTIEGNASGQVSLRDYALTDTYIVGYGLPKYKGKSIGISRVTHEDKSTGWYVVTHEFLNVRASRSATATKLGALEAGDMIQITQVENGWGKLTYKQKTAYVSLDYADFVAPVSHKTRYVSEGKTLLERDFYSTDTPRVAAFTPEREGFLFLSWESEAGKAYASLDALPVADVTLHAVWEEIPPPLPEEPDEDTPSDSGGEVTLEQLGGSLPNASAPQHSLKEELLPGGGTAAVPTTTAAAQHAGVVSGVLSLLFAGAWLARRKREE